MSTIYFDLFTIDCASPVAEYIKLKLRNPNFKAASVVLTSPFLDKFLDPQVDDPPKLDL